MPSPVVVFIGAPASGKSKIAKRVAALLDVPRIDTDKVVVAEHGPIADIFDNSGEATFRAYERAAVKDALQHRAIVSLGGGAVLDPDTQKDLTTVPVVLLTVSEEAVASRISDPKRPLLRDGIEAWKKLVAARMPIYSELAWNTFDTSTGDLDAIAEDIVSWISSGTPRQGVSS
ncbi:MAG: shikimate kinase [Aurantimicrobium sp.]|uniref:shikimate kinase n=1 Tax=Aurantimicrobium sp. TaxID=1930784 RepID=UPI003070D39E